MPELRVDEKGPQVEALQRSLQRLGYPLRPDSDFGSKTLAAVQAYARDRTRDGAPAWLVAAIHAEAAKTASEETAHGIRTVGAWCGMASLKNPERDVAFAVDHHINRLDVIVNDHSTWRSKHAFTIRSTSQIERLCGLARARGIEVHLMSWIMPHFAYIDGAAGKLVPLCERVGAASLQWDAEEPWTRATKRPSYGAAAARIKETFSGLGCQMGVNGIGYAPVNKLGPLAEICDYVVPQAYATATSRLKPDSAPGRFHRRWKESFGRPIVMGLAAYRQRGIAGHTPASAMQAAIDATSRLLDVDTVIYWSLDAIRRSPTVAKAIASIRG